ncbi:MAG: KAP family P-loop NTPase fold protein [Salinarimonas sp.]
MEKAAEEFWKREDGRKAAITQFRDILSQVTRTSMDGISEGKPLVVVIDELDRCRPDYALSVLEVVKHFFAVPRVHFVLGVNLVALGHIVQARYGTGVDAADYLKRFISLSMELPQSVPGRGDARSQIKYFENAASAMGIERNLADLAKKHLSLARGQAAISLRDVEKILSRLVLLPKRNDIGGYMFGWQELIVSLVLLQVMRPDLFKLAFAGRLELAAIDDFYGFSEEMFSDRAKDSGKYNHKAYVVRGLWQFVLSGGEASVEDHDQFTKAFGYFGTRKDDVLADLQRDFFSTFEIVSSRD